MKSQKSLLFILLASTPILTAFPTFAQSNNSDNSLTFKCEMDKGTYTTVLKPDKSDKARSLPLILWDKEYFDSKHIKERCDEAANKLNEHIKNNKHDTILAFDDSKNPMVVCIVKQRGQSCELNTSVDLVQITIGDKQSPEKAWSKIIKSKLGNPNVSKDRGNGPTYSQLNFWTMIATAFR